MCLTYMYDRPEMINKVVLKHRHSTGTWEVILRPDSSRSAGQTTANSNPSPSVKTPVAKSNIRNRSPYSSSSTNFSISSSSNECGKPLQREKQPSPLCHNLKVSKRGKAVDPDYDPGSASNKKSKHSKPHPLFWVILSRRGLPLSLTSSRLFHAMSQ